MQRQCTQAIYHIDAAQLRPDEGWTTDGDLKLVGISLLSLVSITRPIENKPVTLAQPPAVCFLILSSRYRDILWEINFTQVCINNNKNDILDCNKYHSEFNNRILLLLCVWKYTFMIRILLERIYICVYYIGCYLLWGWGGR